MKYALLFFMLPLHAHLFQTVVLLHNGSRVSMFGDKHGNGSIETEQYKHIKDLLIKRSEDKGKPIHVLLEQPQLFMKPGTHASILQQLSTLAQDVSAVTVENIENRATVYAAHTLLKSNEPELVSSVRFDDGTRTQVDLQDVTYGDHFRLFDVRIS